MFCNFPNWYFAKIHNLSSSNLFIQEFLTHDVSMGRSINDGTG